MSVAIRPLRSDDVAAVAQLDGSFLVESRLSLHARDGAIEFEAVPVTPYSKRYEQACDVAELREYLDDESAGRKSDANESAPDDERAAFVAVDADRIVGRILLSRSWNGYALIDDIAVDAAARRSGAGSALIDRALAWAHERGLPGAMLETQDNNAAACRFYQRKGFVLGGFDRFHYANDPELRHETALFWYLKFD